VTALFFDHEFSFGATHQWAMSSTGPIGAAQKLGILRRVQARWQAWRENREQETHAAAGGKRIASGDASPLRRNRLVAAAILNGAKTIPLAKRATCFAA